MARMQKLALIALLLMTGRVFAQDAQPTEDVGDSSRVEEARRDLPHPSHLRRKFRDWRGELPDTRADEGKRQ